VDDGSTDGTPAIADRYASRDARIRVIHKANGGTASALNAGLKAARGEWICWLSSDDLFEPFKLSVHRRWIRQHPDGTVFFTGFRRLDDGTGVIEDADQGPVPPRQWQLLGLLDYNFINGITLCVRRSAFERVGPFDEANPFGQDYGMNLRLLSAHEALFIPERCAVTRMHAGQGGRTDSRLMFQDCAAAAIRFLNRTPFPGLFPLADLDDSRTAAAAVDRCLDIAFSPHAYLNQLGPHPALVLRAMEWLWNCDEPWADSLRRVALWRARAVSRRVAGTGAGTMWRGLAALGAAAVGGRVVFSAVDPESVAERAYACGGRDPDDGSRLSVYMEKRARRLPSGPFGRERRGDLLAAGVGEEDAKRLSADGWRVILLARGECSMTIKPWGWRVGVGDCSGRRLTSALCAVDSWDAAVADPEWAGAIAPACTTAPVAADRSRQAGSVRRGLRVAARRVLYRATDRVRGGHGGPRPSTGANE
jgi:hypothetical protein